MLETSVSAGVDVGSTWLDLGFHPFAKPIRARNSEAGIATIVAALRRAAASAGWRSRRSAAMRESWSPR
jgi:uncharacterized protein YwlG (UPF0340 family)